MPPGHHREPTVVVVSAMAGVTDALLAMARQARAADKEDIGSLIDQLKTRHLEAADALLSDVSGRASITSHITETFHELEAGVRELRGVSEIPARILDQVLARGEQLSALRVARRT